MTIVCTSKHSIGIVTFYIIGGNVIVAMVISYRLQSVSLHISSISVLFGDEVDDKLILGVFSRWSIMIFDLLDVTRTEHLYFPYVAFLPIQIQGGLQSHHIHLIRLRVNDESWDIQVFQHPESIDRMFSLLAVGIDDEMITHTTDIGG